MVQICQSLKHWAYLSSLLSAAHAFLVLYWLMSATTYTTSV